MATDTVTLMQGQLPLSSLVLYSSLGAALTTAGCLLLSTCAI
jgi:hypothetical protein